MRTHPVRQPRDRRIRLGRRRRRGTGTRAAFPARPPALLQRPTCAPTRRGLGCRSAEPRPRPVWIYIGGRPRRSACSGLASGCLRSPPSPRNVPAMVADDITRHQHVPLAVGLERLAAVRPCRAMATAASSPPAAAGPCSRARRIVVTASPPPAESPISAICVGLRSPGRAATGRLFTMSLTGPGWMFSGARPIVHDQRAAADRLGDMAIDLAVRVHRADDIAAAVRAQQHACPPRSLSASPTWRERRRHPSRYNRRRPVRR